MDIVDLAAEMVGVHSKYQEEEVSESDVEDMLVEKFCIGFPELEEIAHCLVKMTIPQERGGKAHYVFGRAVGRGLFLSIYRVIENLNME